MKTWKAIVVIGLLAAAISAALFKLFALYPMMPAAASREAVIVDHAFMGCLWLTIPIFGLVIAALIYIVTMFRARQPDEQGVAFEHSRGYRVEKLWIFTSLILTIGLAAFGTSELRAIRGKPQADLDIQVTASQFSWDFYYPQFGQNASRLMLPKDKRVRLLLTSQDVVHSFWVPQFRTKQDAIPGRVTPLLLTPTQTGSYLLLCNEMCGNDHTDMTAYVDVVEADEFEKKFRLEESW